MSSAMPVDDPPEMKKNALNIIKNWFLQSPSHGIRRINRAESLSARIFWSIIFLIFTTLMCTFIYTTIQKFITHPTKINLSIRQDQKSLHYPAVTFCNLNPLRNDNFLDEFYSTDPQTSATLNDSERRNRYANYIATMLRDNYFSQRMNSFEKNGYELNDLLIGCQFNSRMCYRNFTRFFHPNYGNCYTFNNDEHVESSRTTQLTHFWSIDDTDANDGYKLFMELYLFQDEYLSYLDDRAAFRIFLHRKHEIPILSQTSLLIAPNVFTKLIFSHRQISFSQQCRKDLTDDMKKIFGDDQRRYTQALCYKLCQFRYIQQRCSCTDQLLIIYFQFFRPNQTVPSLFTQPCAPDNPCLTNEKSFNSRKSCPECLPECELIQYTIQSSYADYPSIRSMEKVRQRAQRDPNRAKPNSTRVNSSSSLQGRKENLLENIVAVEISASPYATEILAESPMYTWVDLISSIGGQTGLWIGVSLISFVEIAELVFLLCFHFLRLLYQSILNRWKIIYHRLFDRTIVTKM